MWLRFTAFIHNSDKEVRLYLVQEGPGRPSFKVYAKSEDSAEFTLAKNGEKNWTIIPQNVPNWVRDIQPRLIDIVEQTTQN